MQVAGLWRDWRDGHGRERGDPNELALDVAVMARQQALYKPSLYLCMT